MLRGIIARLTSYEIITMTDQISQTAQVDAVVVGAGFGGMYMLHRLRERGLDVRGVERGGDVGGTWFWNRYPGCRCDVESMEYSYQFSEELQQDWEWTERYAPQPEILAYAQHVADRLSLRTSFTFNTSVVGARFDASTNRWAVTLDSGAVCSTRYLIMATGCLSAANTPDFPGLDDYAGALYHTGQWPADGVDFSGKRVAVIGTGSSGIQSIPLIAQQAQSLTVFQRTPNYSVPAQNRPIDPDHVAEVKSNYAGFRERNLQQQAAFGADYPRGTESVFDVSEEERLARFEKHWRYGGFAFLAAFADIGMNLEANAIAAEFIRNKIRGIVKDPETAERLCPDTVLGCKRLCADTGYFETYNLPHVSLVDVNADPIERFTAVGLNTANHCYEFDAVVLATGFDAMTGSLLRCNIVGADGLALKDKWAEGPRTYLGLMTAGFPNLFMMTGPGSPSVLANMITGVEQHAEFIDAFIQWLDDKERVRVDAEPAAEEAWVDQVNLRADASLFPQCNSWYLGANVPGKPRVFMPYLGFPDYSGVLADVVDQGYAGFACQ